MNPFKLILVIPARYNSTRFPGKPLTIINEKPMLLRVYENAKNVANVEKVIVATDSSIIMDYCEANGIDSMMTSSKHEVMLSRIVEVAGKIHSNFYIVLNGDEPLLESINISKITNGLDLTTSNPYIVRNLVSRVIIYNKSQLLDTTDIKIAVNVSNKILYMSRGVIPFSKTGVINSYIKHIGCYLLSRESLTFFDSVSPGSLELQEDIDLLRFLENFRQVEAIEITTRSVSVDIEEDVIEVTNILNEIDGR